MTATILFSTLLFCPEPVRYQQSLWLGLRDVSIHGKIHFPAVGHLGDAYGNRVFPISSRFILPYVLRRMT